MENLEFKRLDFSGVKTLTHWAEKEGWNPGPSDAAVFWESDPEGFYGCFVEGEMIGGGSIVSYAGEFGFMGFFIVKPAYRNKGIGKVLWYKRRDTLLSRLKPHASIGMDGVVAMQDFYKKGGFEIAFRDQRFERTGAPFGPDAHISAIDSSDIPELLSYDRMCFGFDRQAFMKAWLRIEGATALKYREKETLKGMAVMRKAQQGYKIGPLFADNAGIAEALYKACLNAAIGEAVYLDIPLSNASAVALVEKYGAKYVFECARMYHGKAPELPISKIFGITTFELG